MVDLISKLPKIGRLRPDMAGAIMLPLSQVPLAKVSDTISDVVKTLLKNIKELETINYIYVIDKEGKLKGVISIKEIFAIDKENLVVDIMKKELVRARPRTDQERVAFLALKHNLKAIPVVDKTEKLLGVISSDIILNTLHKEATEDILRLAGVQDRFAIDMTKMSTGALVKARIPWLLVGLAGGILAARILGFFEATLETQIILVFFIPVMLYLSSAVAIQSQTIFIRSLTINPGLAVKTYFLKEIKVGGSLAIICAILLGISSFFFKVSPLIGIILGLSVFLSTTLVVAISIFIPWFLQESKKDPAIGAGPFINVISDVSTLIIYFSVASIMIKFFQL